MYMTKNKNVSPLHFLLASGVSEESRSLPLEDSFPPQCTASWRTPEDGRSRKVTMRMLAMSFSQAKTKRNWRNLGLVAESEITGSHLPVSMHLRIMMDLTAVC